MMPTALTPPPVDSVGTFAIANTLASAPFIFAIAVISSLVVRPDFVFCSDQSMMKCPGWWT